MERKPSFFRPGGTMEPDAPSYIEREADRKLLESLVASEYVFLLDSRQKGKSSLVARTILKLRELSIGAVKLDLQRIGANVTPEQWYAGLLSGIGQELGIGDELFAYWESRLALGPLARWIGAIAEVVLAKTTGPIVIFVDEVDFVRALPFQTDEFFAGIRDCFNRRSEVHGFERLTFCLVGVATPGQLIRNPEITPFNVGTRIDLADFSLSDTKVYAKELSDSGRNGNALLGRVHHWVNGHPYLTQLLCSRIASDPKLTTPHDVDRLIKELFLTPEARQREPNLADVERRILDPDVPGLSPEERRTQVLELYGRLLQGKGVAASEENPVVASLRLAGVGNEDRGALRVRNRIYAHVFDERWRRQSLPQAEMRRMRGAAQMAMLRTASVAGLLIIALTTGAVGVYRISKDREAALKTLAQKTDDLSKVSNDRKKALTDLEIRNEELKRVSGERKAALTNLEETNANLSETSMQRRRALNRLELQTIELKKLSEQRRVAINELESTSKELRAQNYAGLMSSLQVAITGENWAQATDILERARSFPFRGWEWGHAAAQVLEGQVVEVQLPTSAAFERQPDGSLFAITFDAIYEVTPNGVHLRRKQKGGPIYPGWRRGNLRLGQVPATQNEVFRDVDTDRVVAEFKDRTFRFFDFDSQSLTMLADLNQGYYGPNPVRTPEVSFQVRSLDGAKIYHEIKGPAALSAHYLANSAILWADRTGRVNRSNIEGRVLDSIQLPKPVVINISPKKDYFWYWIDTERTLYVHRTSDLTVAFALKGELSNVRNVSFWQPKNRLLVCTNESIIHVYDMKTGQLMRSFTGNSNPLRSFGYVSDDRIATADIFGLVKIFTMDSSLAVEKVDFPEGPASEVWPVDANRLLVQTGDRLFIKNITTGSVSRLDTKISNWRMVDTTASHLFVGSENGRLEKRSLDSLKIEKSLQVFPDSMSRFWIARNGRRLVAETKPAPYSNRTEYSIIDVESMKELSRFKYYWPSKHRSPPDVSMCDDGSLIAVSTNEYNSTDRTGQKNGILHLYSTLTGKVVGTIQRPDSIFDAQLFPDGKQLVMTSQFYGFEDHVWIYDARTLKMVQELPVPKSRGIIADIFVSPNGKYVYGMVWQGPLGRLWDVSSGKLVTQFSDMKIDQIDFSPDGNRLIPSFAGQPIAVWDCKSGRELLTIGSSELSKKERAGKVEFGRFSPNGRDVVITGFDGDIRICHSVPWKDQPKAARK